MKKYDKPAVHIALNVGPLSGDALLQMDDAALEAYLKENAFAEKKKLYRANENYAYREIAGEGVLVPVGDVPGNVMITLNETGAFLWKALQKPQTIEDLLFLAREAYDDPDGTLEAQVREFIDNNLKTGRLKEA